MITDIDLALTLVGEKFQARSTDQRRLLKYAAHRILLYAALKRAVENLLDKETSQALAAESVEIYARLCILANLKKETPSK